MATTPTTQEPLPIELTPTPPPTRRHRGPNKPKTVVVAAPVAPVLPAVLPPAGALAVQSERQMAVNQSSVLDVIGKLISDPAFDVVKLEKMIDLQQRLTEQSAKAEFNEAFVAMRPNIPAVVRRGKISDGKGGNRGKFAKFEDIVAIVTPVLHAHGFAFSHETEPLENGRALRVTGRLLHKAGHEEKSVLILPADDSGGKNAVQALGSASSYGRRYTLINLLGVSMCDEDDDGTVAAVKAAQTAAKVVATGTTPAPVQTPAAKVTPGQAKRLRTIIADSGRNPKMVLVWFETKYQIKSAEDVLQGDYDAIVTAIEAAGPLPL